jgi:hypothetical protein
VNLACQPIALLGRRQFFGLPGILAQFLIRFLQLGGEPFDFSARLLFAPRDLGESDHEHHPGTVASECLHGG